MALFVRCEHFVAAQIWIRWIENIFEDLFTFPCIKSGFEKDLRSEIIVKILDTTRNKSIDSVDWLLYFSKFWAKIKQENYVDAEKVLVSEKTPFKCKRKVSEKLWFLNP